MAYDPIQRHQAIEKLVGRQGSDGQERKYYRFRPARWYGGIVTADCVGCGLLCRFCWVRDSITLHPGDVGQFYRPSQVADILIGIAERFGFKQIRLSGGEPAIGKKHLLQLLDTLQGKGFTFILETNGIPIAYDGDYAEELSKYDFLHARVSLKGCNETEFATLTGAKPEGFNLQLESIAKLTKARVTCHPAVMTSFSSKESLAALVQRLKQISPSIAGEVEIEELILYPHVTSRIQEYGLRYGSSHGPDRVPKGQI